MTSWTPHTEHREDYVAAASARALHDLIDRPGPPPQAGDALPILWHWLAFLPQSRQSELGADGHPRTGAFMPPTDGRRRMYAGGAVTVGGCVAIGSPVARASTVTGVAEKATRSGDHLFVTVEHRLEAPGANIHERSDIVYLDPRRTSSPRVVDVGIDDAVLWGADVSVDSTLLFRFSALTYNAHRIHYDREYARSVEGYPGLVVQGPLQAILLADAAARALPGRTISAFSFRSTASAFDSHQLQLRVRESGAPAAPTTIVVPTPSAQHPPTAVEAVAYSDGVPTMTARAVFDATA